MGNCQTMAATSKQRVLELVLCIDRSGSMGYGEPLTKMEQAKGISIDLIEGLKERDKLGVVAFDNECLELNSLSTVKEGIGQKVQGLTERGPTSIAKGLATAHSLFPKESSEYVVRQILLLTDGRANLSLDGAGGVEGSSALEGELMNLCANLWRNKISVSTVAVGKDAFTNPLRLMSEASSGAFLLSEEIKDRHLNLYRELKETPMRRHPFGTGMGYKSRVELQVHGVPMELPAGRPTWSKESLSEHVAVVSGHLAQACTVDTKAILRNPKTGKEARVALMSIEDPSLEDYRKRKPQAAKKLRANEFVLLDGSYRLELNLEVGDTAYLELY